MQAVVGADVESSFCSSDTRPGCWVVISPHRICLAVAALYGLVHYLQHADVPVIAVRVDYLCHPFKKFVGTLVLEVNVKTWRGGVLAREVSRIRNVYILRGTAVRNSYLSSISILSNLSPWRTMQIDNDIEPRITCPSTDLLQVMQSTLREMFTVRENQILTNPVPNRDTDSIQPVRFHFGDIILGSPGAPVLCPGCVGLCLSKLTDAIEFRGLTTTTHAVPFIIGHPGLDNELRAQVNSADWQVVRKPARGFIAVLVLHNGSLLQVCDIADEGIVPRGQPCYRQASIDRDGNKQRSHD